MPISWNTVSTMPDIASNNRYTVFFPAIRNVDLSGLTLLVQHITIPQKAVGHIIVRLFDQPFGFRGGRQFDNQMQVTFYENVLGEGLGKIENWMDLVRNREGNSLRKSGYAGEGKLSIYNTVGDVIHDIPLINMYPLTVEYPELDEGGSAPLQFTVTFNVDEAQKGTGL